MANQVDFKILPSDQFNVYSPQTRSDKIITYFTLLSKLRGDILAVAQEDDPNDIVSAYYSNVGGTQTLHLVKADGSEVIASQPQQVISGTLNYVSKFTSANDIGDSQIFDDGTNVGIGTTSMTHKLQLGTGGVFADYFQLDTTYSNGFVVGAISWDQDNGTADVGLSGSLKLKVGQDDVWYVKNQTGSTITKGTAVYANGTLGASSRITVAPMIADGTIPARFFLGIVAENIINGADGYVLARGKIRQISTLAYNEGDILWVSPTTAGALTATEPTAPNLKLPVAFVVYKASNGVLAVRATTGTKIADASDVDYTGAVDNSFLVYNSATGIWEDEAIGIFKTIAVSGQTSVIADTYDDTLTFAAGTNVTITTDPGTDTITINSTDQFVGTVTSVATTAPITGGTITTTGTIGITQSGASTDGYLSSTDWNTFNNKEPSLTKGNLTEATSSVLTITGGTNAVIGTGTTIQVSQAGASSSGYLSSTDWNTFNGKASNSFTTIAVATQSSIVADTATDTLTVAAGSGVTITTDALTDTLTISATGSGGTVTSVDLTAGTGISVSGGPITTSGSITVTNTAPDQTVVLTAGTGITTSGTYPNFTVTNSAPDQVVSLTGAGTTSISGTYPNFTITSNDQYDGTVTSVDLTAGTGISVSGGPITSSGSITVTNTAPDQTVVLTAGTGISTSGTYPNFTITNSAPDQVVALTASTGISVTGTYPNFTITNTSPSSGGTITGSGTTNYLSKWTSGTALGDSLVFDNGTNVGIGTAAPKSKLQIIGPTLTTNNENSYAVWVSDTGDDTKGLLLGYDLVNDVGVIQAVDQATSWKNISIASNGGNVSIGTTTNSGARTNIFLSEAGATPNAILRLQNTGSQYLAKMILTDGTTNDAVIGYQGGVTSATQYLGFGIGTSITQMILNASGNVGIGTTSPGDKLHVNAGGTGGIRIQADSEPSLYLNTTDGAANATLFNSYGNVGLVGYATSTNYIMYHYGGGGTLANQYTYFQTAGAERMRINGAGNVGIGTTAPTLNTSGRVLHINSLSNEASIVHFTNATTGALANDGLIVGRWSDGINYLYTYENEPLHFGTNSSIRMVITDAGNVGIGTTAPQKLLHISGGSGNVDNLVLESGYVSSGVGVAMQFNRAGGVLSRIRGIEEGGWNGGLLFEVRNGASSNPGYDGATNVAMKIATNGNVGIGTTAPGQKLQVDGNIYVNDDGTTGNGIMLRGADRPLIARGWDPFTSGNKTGVGRWGVYMESSELFIGAPGTDYSNALITLGGWLVNGTREPNLTLNNSTQRVGIGTTAPGNKLAILAPDTTGVPTLGTNQGHFGIFNGNLGGSYGLLAGIINNGNAYLQVQRIDGTATAYNMLLQPSGGNVGIGTTAPPIKLYVGTVLTGTNGNGTYASDAIAINSSESITIGPDRRADWVLDATTATSTTFQSKLNIWSDNENHITFGGASTHLVSAWESFKIWINNDSGDAGTLHLYHTSSKTEFVRLAGSGNNWINGGNVGIGTTNPLKKLVVTTGNNTNSSSNKSDALAYFGGGNDNPDAQNISFPNPSITDLSIPGMYWWSADVMFGRYKNEAFWSIKETHGGSLGSSQRDIIRCYFYDSGGYSYIDKTVIPSGNVGIGTTAPNSILDVRGASAYFHLQDTGDNRYFDIGHWIPGNIQFEAGNGDLYIKTQTSNFLAFGTTGSERLRITSAGNVGIGTTAPTYGLVVANQSTANSATGTMYIGAALNGSGKGLVIDSATRTTSDNAVLALEIINRAGGNTMAATVAGNVGIGTTSPGEKLHVVGGIIRIDSNTGGFYQYNTSGVFRSAFYDNGTVTSIYGDGNGSTPAITINDNNVGIGTTSPGALLHVAGVPRFDASGGAPSDTSAPVTQDKYYGTNSVVLTSPNNWLKVDINGTAYVIPAYSI